MTTSVVMTTLTYVVDDHGRYCDYVYAYFCGCDDDCRHANVYARCATTPMLVVVTAAESMKMATPMSGVQDRHYSAFAFLSRASANAFDFA